MKKRNLFAELTEGVEALAEELQGKRMFRTTHTELKGAQLPRMMLWGLFVRGPKFSDLESKKPATQYMSAGFAKTVLETTRKLYQVS